MAVYYWVGGSGTWDNSTTTNWSATSGGSGGAGVPTSADDVIFDTASGAGNYTVTFGTGTATCNALTAANPSGGVLTFGVNTSDFPTVYGGATFASGVVYTPTRLDVAGNLNAPSSLATTDINTLGNLTLTANLSAASVSVNLGHTFSTAGFTVTLTGNITLSSTSTLTLGASAITCSGLTRNGNATVNAGTSTITFTAPLIVNGINNAASNTLTLYNVIYDMAANNLTDATIAGTANITMNSFRVTQKTSSGVGTIRFTSGRTITITNAFTVDATSGPSYRWSFQSITPGTAVTISAGSYSVTDCDFQDITASGTTITGTRLGNRGGNTNITFPVAKTVYWNLAGTNNWDATAWATSSGGAPASANFPLAQDTVVFDNTGAITQVTVNGTNSTATGGMGFAVGTVSMTRTSAFTFATSSALFVYGDFTASSGVTFSGSFGGVYFSGRGTQNITSAGKTWSFGPVFNGPGGTVVLADAFTSSTSAALTYGTLNLNGKTLTVTAFSTSNSNTRNITFNAGTLVVTTNTSTAFNAGTSTGFTTTAGTGALGLISFTGGVGKTLAGGGVTYNCIVRNNSSTALLVTGSNTFIGVEAASSNATFSLASSSTTSVGYIATLVTVLATGAANATIRYSGYYGGTGNLETAPNVSVTKITFSGGTWYVGATSTNGGSNVNVSFTTPAKFWVGGSGTWDTTTRTNWALTSGGTSGEPPPVAPSAVTFDASSSGTSSYTVTMTGALSITDLTVSALTPTFTSTATLSLAGSLALAAGTVWSATGLITFTATTSKTVSTNGVSLAAPVTFNGVGGSWQLLSAFTTASANTTTLTAGTLNLNGFTFTTGLFNSSGATARVIAFGTGNITVNGTGTVWTTATTTNLSITGTPVVNVSNNTATATTVSPGSLSEANSISFNFTTGTYSLTMSAGNWRSINFTGFAGTVNNVATSIFGDLTLASGATYTAGTNAWTFASTSATPRTITTNAKTVDWPLTFNGVGGTWALQDALTMGSTRTLTHTNGTIDLNGKTLTVGTAYTTAAGTKNLTFNAGTLVCPTASTTAFNNAAPINFTTTAGTGTGFISMTAATAKTFVGGGSTFNCTLRQAGVGTLTITGANTFANIGNTTQPATVIFPASTTTTFTSGFGLTGIAGNLITIQSSVAGTRATVSLATGTVNVSYCSIKDSSATGGATWNASTSNGNVDAGNNLGWSFVGGTSVTVSPTGVFASGAVGTATVAAKATVQTTGPPGTGAVGTVTVAAKASTTVTGVSATGSVGTASVAAGSNTTLTGVSATGSVGSVTVFAVSSVQVTLTGVEATGTVGTVTASIPTSFSVTDVFASGFVGTPTVAAGASATVTDVSATGSVSSVTVSAIQNASVTLSGVSASGDVGSVLVAGRADIPVTGVSATGLIGTVSVLAGASATLTGVSATGSLGSVSVSGGLSVTVTGVSASGAVGSATATGKANVFLDGVEASGLVGDVTVFAQRSVSVTLTGVSATGSVGTATASISTLAPVTGVSATGSVGNVLVAANCNAPATGVSATGYIGSVETTSNANVALTGVSATGSIGTVATRSSYYVTGVQATGAVGNVSTSSKATVYLTGVEATGVVAKVLVWGQINDNQDAHWMPIDDSQTAAWSAVNDTQAPGWVLVNDTQAGAWTPVNDGNTVVWTEIPT